MRKVISISIVIASLLLIANCAKDEHSLIKKSSNLSKESSPCSVEQRVGNTIKLSLISKSIFNLSGSKGNGELLDSLFSSSVWATIPNEILSEISVTEGVKLADYKNTKVRTLVFKLHSDKIYKSLAFYCLNGEFIPVIVSSENKDGKKYLAVSDLFSLPYFNFFVNNDNKMERLQFHQKMPRFRKPSSSEIGSKGVANPTSATPTCMEITTDWISCMECALQECGADLICTIACSVFIEECVLTWSIACIF